MNMAYGIFFSALCLVVSFDLVYGAVSLLPPQQKPDEFANEEGCYVPDLSRVLPYDQPFSPQDGSSCVQYTCRRSDNYTSIFTCGSVAPSEKCDNLLVDNNLAYPDCCPKQS